MWCICGDVGEVEEMMCVRVLQRGYSCDGCDLSSYLCNGDLFVLSWKGGTSETYVFRSANV